MVASPKSGGPTVKTLGCYNPYRDLMHIYGSFPKKGDPMKTHNINILIETSCRYVIVSKNRETPQKTLKYFNPYYTDPRKVP